MADFTKEELEAKVLEFLGTVDKAKNVKSRTLSVLKNVISMLLLPTWPTLGRLNISILGLPM